MTTKKDSTAVASPVSTDVDALAPEPDVITLASGSVVRIERLRTRQLFKLLKIITRGAGPLLSELNFSTEDQDAFTGQMIGLIIMAVPEAEDQAIEFIQEMAKPIDWIDRPKNKSDREINASLIEELFEELENPEIEDTVLILQTIIQNEASDIQALGKRLAAMFKMNVASAEVNSSSRKN